MATNILHLARGDFGQTASIILEGLLNRGMRIRLLQPTDKHVTSSQATKITATIGNRPLGVGIKPYGVELSLEDYIVYARIRDELLKGPAGRAALLQGGIVWRLALNLCTIEDTSRGPETGDSLYQSQTRIQLIDGKPHVETCLTQQDQYIIVGVYRILQREYSIQGSKL